MMAPRNVFVIAAALVLAGCASTPEPVLQLAEKSSANAGVVSARLRQLGDASDTLFANRAANVARLHAATTTERAHFNYDLALTRKVGQSADLVLMQELQDWTLQVGQLFEQASQAEKTRREELAAAQAKIDNRSQALQKVAQVLSTLAQKESAEERAKLLATFASEVRDDVKKQLEDGSASSNAAKALLDQLKAAKP